MLEPAHKWVPEYATSYGNLAAEVGDQVGMPMDDEQRMILDAIFAENEPGRPACFSVAVVAPRQNLKTATLEIAALTDVFVLGEPMHAWTAHLFDTALKTFEHMCELIEGCDDFRRRCRKPKVSNGKEAIELLTGEKIEFHARSKGGGRGITGDKITWDEALFLSKGEVGALMPILATRRGAQVRYGSSAGFVSSEVLRAIRDRGRRGGSRRAAYFEWCAPRVSCEDPTCSHKSGEVVGCVADRLDLLQIANPQYGGRITVERMQDFRDEMPADEFIREFLGWWDEPGTADAAFGPGNWERCESAPPVGVPMAGLGIAASMDLTHGAIVGSGRDGNLVHVKPLHHAPGTHWTVARAKQLQDQHRVDVAIDSRGPAAVLIPALERAGVRLRICDTTDVLDACATTLDLVREQRLRHAKYAELDLAVNGAVRRMVGDRWAWGRKVSTADISTLEAGTLAAWLAAEPVLVSTPAIPRRIR